ncbi:hypothetical protein NDA14_004129 [Ustilago hordei]|nr:hypothetical protein NDA14_001292 [Ustilago hordei]KAJ1603857.1 hypothetical protein NDA14_004129 [Ustilago hordei]
MADGGGGAAGGGGGGRFFGGGGDGGAAAASSIGHHTPPHSHHPHPTHGFGGRNQQRPTSNATPTSQNPRTAATSFNARPPQRAGATGEEAQWSLKDIYWQGRECKIITQNQNGPCSLIALCNILLLRGELQITPPDRPVVSYTYLSGLLAEHLLTKGAEGEEFQAALSILPRTQYGLDVDVGFDSIRSFAAAPGNNGGAGELALFRLCGVELVHGWLPDPADGETFGAVQTAGSYNKAVDIVVRGDEVANGAVVKDRGVGVLAATLSSEAAVSNGKAPQRNGWSDEQRATVRHALALQSFLDTQSTQLTYHGLFVLAQELPAGQPVALFRNSHLSALYKRLPHEGVDAATGEGTSANAPPTLFTLATDSSFLMEDEIVWESLVDVDGASSEFYDGKFKKSTMRQGDYVGREADGLDGAGGRMQNEDADYALAMQIYQNDQERLQRHEQRRRDRRSTSARQQQSSMRQGNVFAADTMGATPQQAFETPNEVFTTMRYEVTARDEQGDALVVKTLIPQKLQDDNASLLSRMQGLSMGQSIAIAPQPAVQSTNPFLKPDQSQPTPVSTNPFLNTAAAAATTSHRLYRHIPLLDQHLERLRASTGAICRAYSAVWSMALLEQERSLEPQRILEAVESSLASSPADGGAEGQVKGIRVAINKDGSIKVTQRSISPFPSTVESGLTGVAQPPAVRLDAMPTRVRTMDLEPIVFNKTDARGFYEAAKQRAGADPSVLSGMRERDGRCFDVILWNDERTDTLDDNTADAAAPPSAANRLVTESSLANVVVELLQPNGGQSRFVTPRTSTGMLDGLLRHWLVEKGVVEEEDVQVDELYHCVREGTAQVWLCNSLRGIWRVDLADPPGGTPHGNIAMGATAGGKTKQTRFSSFIRSYSRHNSYGPTPAAASDSAAVPPAIPEQAVHSQVADDLYGHKQGKKDKKGKKIKGDKKDCIIM